MREYTRADVHASPVTPRYSTLVGFGTVCVGVAVSIIAALRHRGYIAALRQGIANPELNINTLMILAGTVAVVGLAIAVYLLML